MESLDGTQLELLRLVTYGRDTPTLRFLLREHLPGTNVDIDAELATMRTRGWIALSEDGRRWERTPAGEDVLRSNEAWEFVVEEVFEISGRPHPIVTGTIRFGNVRTGDHFVLQNRVGRGLIAGVEFHVRRGDSGGLAVSGVSPRAGDVLVREEPTTRTGAALAREAQAEPEWLAFGIDLTLSPTSEGGRRSPISLGGRPLIYRPNWGLPQMTGTDQSGAPVLILGKDPLAPGERTRAVIIPLVDLMLMEWDRVMEGDELRMFEGARICGTARVEWKRATRRPASDDDAAAFTAWARGERDDVPGRQFRRLSSSEPAVRLRVESAIDENGDVVVWHRINRGAGSTDWYLLRSIADFDEMVGYGREADAFLFFLQAELPVRGTVDERLTATVLDGLRASDEWVIGTVKADSCRLEETQTFMPEDDEGAAEWLREHAGMNVISGPFPPSLSVDPDVVLAAYVPLSDGTIVPGVY